MSYEPLFSVCQGKTDGELLEQLICFYSPKPPKSILDATINAGRFWKGSPRKVIGLDTNTKHRPTICGDNRLMPFKSEAFDLVVYDPPHIPNKGRDKKRDFNSRFGLDEFNEGYEDFMREAHRVLVDNGILLAKISDYVHHHRYRWAHIEAVQAATNSGFTACDLIVKVRKAGALIDPRWETAHHSRRIHTYWIIFRKSPLCQKWWRPPKE